MSFLEGKNLSKSFGDKKVLWGIDLQIEQGEFVCILGPSGCGKTTLLRIIAGLEAADAGQVMMDGRDCTLLPPAARDYGIVFQSYALFPNLSVRQNVTLGLAGEKRWSKGERQEKVSRVLGLVDLTEHAYKFPAQLSGGQQQRAALARALAVSPKFLFLDEPLSALDAKVRSRLRGEIRRIQQELAITCIMVTHDQEEALTMADRVVVMQSGRIEQVGTPVEIYRQPLTAFAAEFIGTMNFLADGQAIRGIRPEDIQIFPDSAFAAKDLAGGRVKHAEFRGAMTRVFVELRGGQEVCVDLTSEKAAALALYRGMDVYLRLPEQATFAQALACEVC